MRFLTCTLLALLVTSLVGCSPRGGRGGGGGADDDDDTSDLPEDDSQVSIELFGALAFDEGFCDPDTDRRCADYEIALHLDHDGIDPLAYLDFIAIRSGAMEFTNTLDCAASPWRVDPEGGSENTELLIRYDGEGGQPTMYHRCGNELVSRTNSAVGDAPITGMIEVEVHIAGDEFLHVATASRPLEPALP
ncbi:MAG: hypothetical protein KDA24_03255 [Deltaproteobacteria bacterium]|nr:hypothetical protein [Deltaproteobacteria bacterium]